FRHNAKRPLDADVLIVDECSMIDLALFYKLFEAIDLQRTKVILLGDKNQLASVEAGSVFRDLRSEERRVGKEWRCRRTPAQAEDGIRDFHVTGVQTCALPIFQT